VLEGAPRNCPTISGEKRERRKVRVGVEGDPENRFDFWGGGVPHGRRRAFTAMR